MYLIRYHPLAFSVTTIGDSQHESFLTFNFSEFNISDLISFNLASLTATTTAIVFRFVLEEVSVEETQKAQVLFLTHLLVLKPLEARPEENNRRKRRLNVK